MILYLEPALAKYFYTVESIAVLILKTPAIAKSTLATKAMIRYFNCHFSCRLTTQAQEALFLLFFKNEKFFIFR